MALISCPECGKQINDNAISCPNCGNPIQHKADEARIVRPIGNDSNVESKILEIAQSQSRDSAVIWYKDEYNCGLKEANDAVDATLAKHNITIPTPSSSTNGSGCSIIILIGISITLGAVFLL